MRLFILFIIFFLCYIHTKSNSNVDFNFKEILYNYYDINQFSIFYELSYNKFSAIKVIIITYYKISKNIKFKAFLKSEDQILEYELNCLNKLEKLILCIPNKNYSFDTNKKYFFYYNNKKFDNNITFNGKEIFEDDRRISLIFKPKISPNQILYKDKKIFIVNTNNNMVSNGYLYLTKSSKKVLQKPKNGFNKYIELNNFIPHCGLYSYRPQSTLIAYKEAIRRGYKIVDGDIVFTKDKIPVICHGTHLDSISNGHGDLTKKTLKELEKMDFGIKFNKQYKGEKILKFEELLNLCKNNNIIVDLDLYHLDYNKYFKNTNEYAKIILEYIDKYDMFNSIFFNEFRKPVIEQFKILKKDTSFSINGMNEKKNIDKIKDMYKDSKILIYNMGSLTQGKIINRDTVKYGLSLGKKIKASKIDDILFAKKVIAWGVNFICTNKLHPFLMKNEKEEPIIVKCTSSNNEGITECRINEKFKLIDNQIYSIYYSTNIYNILEDIVEEPIGFFKYINTNSLNKLYYNINYFNFQKGIIKLDISNKIKRNEKIFGTVGPAYDNVAECYLLNFVCLGNDIQTVDCFIYKNETDKVKFEGNYKIYSLEGYSLKPKKLNNKLKNAKIYFLTYIYHIIILVFLIVIIIYKIKNYKFFLK